MKTAREILFARHRSAEPRLDRLRQSAVAAVCDRRAPRESSTAVADRRYSASFSELLRSFRWHLAGMGLAWMLVLILNIEHSPAPVVVVARQKIPPAQVIFAALRENRQQLLEIIQPSAESREAESRKTFLPRPRSERHHTTLIG